MELELIKKSLDKIVYVGEFEGELYVFKELLTKAAENRMERSVELLKYLKNQDPTFPCACPIRMEDGEGNHRLYKEKFIRGACLQDVDIGKRDMAVVCSSLVGYLCKLRSIGIKAQHRKTECDWESWMIRLVEECKERINKGSLAGRSELAFFINEMEHEMGNLEMMGELSYVHNDLNAENIILRPDDNLMVIDYERWIIGDPLKDLSKMMWYLRNNAEFRIMFMKLYEDSFGRVNYEQLALFFKLDILYHISLYDDLIRIPIWKHYFCQEFKIINLLYEGNFNIWEIV